MIHLKIGLRNLLRNKRRTLVTMLALVFGSMALLVFGGYVDYAMWGMRENTIMNGLGHIQLYRKGYNARKGESVLRFLIEDYQKHVQYLSGRPFVKNVTPELTLKGLLSSGDRTEMCLVKGVDVEKTKVFQNSHSLVAGAPLQKNDSARIIIGKRLADKLDARPGMLLTLMCVTRHGSFNALDFEISGIVETGVQEYDEIMAVLPLPFVQRLLDVQGVERLIVLLEQTGQTPQLHAMLTRRIKRNNLPLETRTWEELAVLYNSVKGVYQVFFRITEVVIVLIVLFSIMNTMSMTVFERMRELGTVRALGLSKRGVVRMLLLEGLWLALLGCAAGIVLGSLLALLVNQLGGIYIPPPPTMTRGYYSLILPASWRYLEVLLVSLVAVAAGTMVPALKAARIRVADALRFV